MVITRILSSLLEDLDEEHCFGLIFALAFGCLSRVSVAFEGFWWAALAARSAFVDCWLKPPQTDPEPTLNQP